MTEKTCTGCGQKKPLDWFHCGVGKPFGRASKCKLCEAARKRESYYSNVKASRARGRAYTQAHRRTPRGRATSLIGEAKRRARLQGVSCTLSAEWVTARIEQGCCSVTGITFDLSTGHGRWKKRPFTPSIDRIRAGGDYTSENCRIVCLILNEAMGQWGLIPVLQMARTLVEEHG